MDPVWAEQLDRGVGELPASFGRVVLSTCGNWPSLELAAVGRGGFSVQTGGDPLQDRIEDTRSRRCLGERSLKLCGSEVLDGLGRDGEVDGGQLLELAVLGEDERAVGAVGREASLLRRRVEHHREAGPAAGGDADDVAAAEGGEDAAGLRALGRGPALGRAALGVGEPAAEGRVLEEVAPVAADLPGEVVAGLLDPAEPAGQADDPAVGLELGEARLEEAVPGELRGRRPWRPKLPAPPRRSPKAAAYWSGVLPPSRSRTLTSAPAARRRVTLCKSPLAHAT